MLEDCMSTSHWTLISAWSKAGIGSCAVFEQKISSLLQTTSELRKRKRHRLAFDIGATSSFDDAISAKYVFLSHGHIDHAGAIFSHSRAHAVSCSGDTPTYFVPAALVPQLEQCREAMSYLDASQVHSECVEGRKESLIKMNFIAVHPGDEFILQGLQFGSKTSFFMRAFEVDHAGHPALGYLIGSRITTGLKKEYQHLDSSSLRDLVKSGVVIQSDPIERIEVAYSGDTCARGLVHQSIDIFRVTDKEEKNYQAKRQFFQAELILCELTFLNTCIEERCKAKERGHLHICDLEEVFSSYAKLYDKNIDESSECCSDNLLSRKTRHIVFYHLSGRYGNATHTLNLIAENLPYPLRSRCQVAISSLLLQDEKKTLGKLVYSNGCISLISYLAWRDRPE